MRLFIIALITVTGLHPLIAQQQRDVGFTIVEKPPIHPKCKGQNPDKLKECFRNNIEEIINQNLDFGQFEKVLPQGLHRVFVTFTVDKEGLVRNLKVRTPHLSVQRKTEEALENIPKLKPAIHKNEPRATAFATAFSIDVKEGKEVVIDTSTAAKMRPRYRKTR